MADTNTIHLRRRPFLQRIVCIYLGYRRMHFGPFKAARLAWQMARL